MPRSMAALALGALLLLAAVASVRAADELPEYCLIISVDGAELDAGQEALPPPALPDPVATVAAGETVQLRAKVVGGRRALMMWPGTYADMGAGAVINERGWDCMAFTENPGPDRITSEWSVREESYSWDTGGRGVVSVSAAYATGEGIIWTAPAEPGDYAITVIGRLDLTYVREGPNIDEEKAESSGPISATLNVRVTGDAPAPPVETPPAPPVETPPAPPVETPPAPLVETPPAPPVETPPAQPVETPPAQPVETPPAQPVETPPAQPAVDSNAPVILSPLPGAGVPPRVEVHGTGPPGTVIVVYTEVRAVDDDRLIKNVPGLRGRIERNGAWHGAIATPALRANVATPLYYVIKAYYATSDFKSSEAAVTVHRK